MLLIAGLGNPGPTYAKNRHNIGFMAVDEIARRWGFSAARSRFQAHASEGQIDTPQGPVRVLILKPQGYYNESGRAVGEALRFYKLGMDALTVFHDELDLAPFKVKVKTGGGTAGHNGLRSIDQHLGPDPSTGLRGAFRRVRLGIGHPGIKELVSPHVLGDFAKSDKDWLEPLLDAVAGSAELLVKGDDSSFMNKLSRRIRNQPVNSPPLQFRRQDSL